MPNFLGCANMVKDSSSKRSGKDGHPQALGRPLWSQGLTLDIRFGSKLLLSGKGNFEAVDAIL